MKVDIKKLPKSEVEITGELAADIFEAYYSKALKRIGDTVKLDGFRDGKVPENILASKIPEISVLEEMANMAINEHYPKILEQEKIDAISRPVITITKLARKEALGFKIKTAVLPPVKLPEYKKLAKKILSEITEKEKDTTVSDEDLENTILDIRKARAPKVNLKDVPDKAAEGDAKLPEPELPPFDEAFVKGLGPFESLEDFKTKLRENLKIEKVNNLKEKTRIKIIEKIIDESEVDLPEILVEIETDNILYKMESDISQMGLKFDDYLKHLNKTREDLRKEFRKDAEKKAKLSIILNDIAKVEKIEAPKEAVAQEVAHILEHYKQADPERARMHAENVLTNEMIFNMLENQ